MHRTSRRHLALILATLLSAHAPGAASAATPAARSGPSPQLQERFTFRRTERTEVRYLLSLPKDYAKDRTRQWPLLLFLHGAGERGTNLSRVAVHGPPKKIEQGENYPFVVVSPQCPEGQIWDDNALLGLLDRLIATHRIDPRRIYLTGLSMGGYGTWSLATKHPERFAAVAPICGGGERIRLLLLSQSQRTALKSLGIWAFHGAKDGVVPLEESERMIKAVKAAGNASPKLTVYPDADHDSWSQAYNEPELVSWFLKHSR